MGSDGSGLSAIPVFSPKSGKAHSYFVSLAAGRVDASFSQSAPPDSISVKQEKIFRAAVAFAEGAGGGKLIVPLSARSMVGHENTDRVLNVLRDLDAETQQRFIIEMHDLPRSMSLEAVEKATIPLLLFVGGFLVRVNEDVVDATVFANCNYLGLSTDAAPTDENANPIRNAWALAVPRRLKLFVWNADGKEQLDDVARMEAVGYTTVKAPTG